jgi:hypothetical protein
MARSNIRSRAVARSRSRTVRSAYDRCAELFATYPLAIQCVDWAGVVHLMVLMVANGDGADYFMLVRDRDEGETFYSIGPWRPDSPLMDIVADGGDVPRAMATALNDGVPLPCDGSLFGWLAGNAVRALIAIYGEYTPESPEPSWAVMPRADVPAQSWPPFTGERLFGSWFWEHYRAGTIVPLADLVAASTASVFWVSTEATLGWDCCVISRDIKSDAGYVLPRGCYLYHEALRRGVDVPPPEKLLAGPDKTDLAPRLRSLTDTEQCADELPAGRGLYGLPCEAHNLPHHELAATQAAGVAWRGAGGTVVGRRRGGLGRFLAVVALPSLIRWSLLRDSQHNVFMPGKKKKKYAHVVCSEPGCTNDGWVTLFRAGMVPCRRHPGQQVSMDLCEDCRREPGFHPLPGNLT